MAGFESLGGYTATGGFTPEVGFSIDTANTKQANLARIAAEKKTALIPLSTVRHNDADTFNIPNSNIRLDGLTNGAGVDSWEVPHAGRARPAKLDLQREALAKLTGLSVNQITDQDVYEFGNKSNEFVKSVLRKGQEGVANPQVAITTSDELDKFNRKLANVSNPITGEDLATALNNPLHNAGYDAFYNKSKKASDAHNPDRPIGDLTSDSLKSLLGKGSLGLSTLLAGVVDLPGRAVSEALYRAGVNDSTWAPNDATHLYESINDAKKQINDSMSPTLKKEIALLDQKISTRDATRDFRTRKTAEQLGASENVKDFVIAPMKWGADVARDVMDGLIDHPAAAVDMMLENVVTMGASGAAAKTGVKALVAKTAQTAATEAKLLAAANPTASSVTTANALSNVAEKATELAAKSGELKTLATMTAQEVTGNTGETLSGVMNTPINELRSTSPDFRTAEKLFIAQGLSPEEAASKAQLQVANDSANAVAVMTAITAPLAAKLTGASKFESNLFNKTGVVGKAVGGLRSELPEETLQGFTGQLASNVAEQTYVDPTTSLSKDLAGATAKSALAGGLMGATVPAAIDMTLKAPQAISTIANVAAEGTGYVAGKTGSAISNAYNALTQSQETKTLNQNIQTAHTSGDYSSITPSNDISSIDIVNSLIESPVPINADSTVQTNYINKLREQAVQLKSELYDLVDATENLTESQLATEENQALLAKRDQMHEILLQAKGLLDTHKINNSTEVDERIASIPAGTQIDITTLGSILPKSTEAQLDTLASMVSEDSVEAQMITNRREVLNTEKSSQNVSAEVRDGAQITNKDGSITTKLGYTQHQEAVAEAVQANNPEATAKAITKFGSFLKGMESKVGVYIKAGNIITAAEHAAKNAIAKATPENKAAIQTEHGTKVSNAIAEANALFAKAGILRANGQPVNYPNARLIQGTRLKIEADVAAIKAALNESSYLAETITNRTKQEKGAIDKAYKNKGIAGLETKKADKQARLSKLDATSPAASQIRGEITYIDSLISKDTNGKNNTTNATSRVATVPSEPTSDNTQGSVGNQPADTTGIGLGDITRTSTPSSGTDVVSGTTSEQKDTLTTEPVNKPARKPRARRRARTLQGTLKELGGISYKDLLDITGESARRNLRAYKNAFSKTARWSLRAHIENGSLDQYLPYNMRLEANGMNDEAFDSQPAYDYLAELIKNGDKVIAYDAMIELQQLAYQGDPINDVTEVLTEDEINEQIQQAEDEEGTGTSDAQITDTSNTDSSATSSTGTENTEVINEASTTVGSQDEPVVTLASKLSEYTNDLLKFFGIKQSSNPIANNPNYFDTVPVEYEGSNSFERIASFVNKFTTKLDSTINLNSKYGSKLTELLADSTGKLPKEILNLIATSTYEWMLTMGNKSIHNGRYEIASIMGISEEQVTQAMLTSLSNMGTLRSVAAISIGKQVLREAGITSKSAEVTEEYFENLAAELGLHALNALVQSNQNKDVLAEYHALTSAQYNALLNDASEADIDALPKASPDTMKGGMVFISLGAVVDTELGVIANPTVTKLIENGNSVVKLLNDIQKKEDTRPKHLLKKPTVKNISKYMKGTVQQVPKKMLDIAVKYMQQENYVDTDNSSVFSKLSPKYQYKILGYKEAVNDALQVVSASIKKTQSVNAGIMLSVQRWNEFVAEHSATDTGLNTPFYLPSEFWKQLRLGMNSTTVNTQTDKLHRALITRNKPHTVAFNDVVARQYHVRALAQAFGAKTDNLDPFNMARDISELISADDLLIFEAAAEAINEAGDNAFTDAQSELIVKAVDKGGEGMHTYSGIVALAKELKALKSNSASFETTLSFEVDGKTNGVIIGLLQLVGAKDLEELKLRMARGGLFTDDLYNSYHEYQSKVGNYDTYEAFGVAWKNALNSITESGTYDKILVKNGKVSILQGISNIIGSLNDPKGARKLSKLPVTKNAFGASSKSISKAFGAEALDTLHDKLNDNINDLDALNAIALDVQAVTGKLHVFTETNKLDAFPFGIEKAFQNMVAETYGESLSIALAEEYKDLIAKRTILNSAMKLTFKALEIQYANKLDAILKENAAKGIDGITKDQRDGILESIQDVSPVIKSYFSQSVEDSIVAYKDSKASVDKAKYTGQANSTKKMTVYGLNNAEYEVSAATAVASLDYIEEPGVAAVIQMVHSLDSATMMLALEEMLDAGIPTLNIFDAVVTSANDSTASDTALNGAFKKVMQEYNMVSEFRDTYRRVMLALTPAERATLNEFINNDRSFNSLEISNPKSALKDFTQILNNTVEETTKIKEKFFKVLTSTNQYVGVPVPPVNPYDTQVTELDNTEMSETEAEQFNTDSATVLEEAMTEIKEATNNTDTDTLGSTTGGIDPNTFQSDIDITLSEYNINYVMDNLGKATTTGVVNKIDTTTHAEYLAKYVSDIASNLAPKIRGLVLRTKKSVGDSIGAQLGRYILLEVGTSSAATLQSKSAQEIFAHEVTHTITEYGLRTNSLLRNQVELLKDRVMNYWLKQSNPLEYFLTYDSAGNILTTGGNTVAQEIAAAQAEFDYIFGLDNSGKSWITKAPITGINVENHNNNSIHEFVANGKTNAKFMALLADPRMNEKLKKEFSAGVWNKNVFIMIGNIFAKIMDTFISKLTVSTSLNADTQLDILVGKLTKVVNRNDPSFQESTSLDIITANKAVRKLTNMLLATTYVVANSSIVANSKRPVIAAVSGVAKAFQHIPYADFRTWVKTVQRRIGISDRNFAIAMARETFRGRTEENSYLFNFISAYKHGVDQARNDIRTRSSRNLLSAFTSTNLTNDQKFALTKIVVKLELFTAVDEYGIATVQKMLTDSSAVKVEIAKLEASLKNSVALPTYYYYTKMAESLGNRLVHGQGTQDLDHKNAHTIVRELSVKHPANLDKAEKTVELLAVLHGIAKSDTTNKTILNDLITSEYAKPTDQLTEDGENGIQYLFEYSKDLKARSLEYLFDNNKTLMEMGYTKDLLDPKIQFVVATKEEAVAQRLAERGYEFKYSVKRDKADKSNKGALGMYVNLFEINSSRVSASFSVMEDASRGTLLTDTSVDDVIKTYASTVANQATSKDTATTESFMSPIRNLNNEIVGFRYQMPEQAKNDLLKKNNLFDQILGAMDADISIKPAAKKINVDIIKALYKDYKANYAKDPKGYVAISPSTTDKELRDIYRLMPREAIEAIKDTFGGKTLYIREQDVRLVFGFKKFSITQFDKHWTAEQRATASVLEKTGMKIAELLNTKYVTRGAHMWEFAVKTAKDAIVIKFGAVMAANIASNNSVLWTKGLSLKMIGLYQIEAIDSFNKYQKDFNTVSQIEMRIRLNPSLKNNPVVMGKLSNAKSAITNNPVTKLLDAGVFQSIIEDVEASDVFSFKAVAEEYLGDLTKRVPAPLKTFGNVLILSHETRGYRALKITTQMSDFVARYALHKFNMDQKNKDGSMKFTEQASIEDVNDTFILYDVPTSPAMQALNDNGLFMFTKYALRIKKILFKAAVRAPGRVLNSILFTNYVTGMANMYDSTFNVPGFNNPMGIIDTLTDIPLVEVVQVPFSDSMGVDRFMQ